jgi:signal transduction histidine kinase/ActR/RegA family two-component response regulator
VSINESSGADPRVTFLCNAIAELSGILEEDAIHGRMARLGVPSFADICAVDVLDSSTSPMRRVGVAHIEPAGEEILWELGRVYSSGVWPANIDLLRTGRAEVVEISDALLEKIARDAQHLSLLRSLGLRCAMTVPVRFEEDALYLWTFGMTASGRSYSRDDLRIAEHLAPAVSAALRSARRHRDAAESLKVAARFAERMERMQSVTAALSGALTPIEVSRIILEGSLSALGAAAAAIGLLTEDGRAVEIMHVGGRAGGYLERSALLPLNAPLPIVEAIRTEKPVWLERASAWGEDRGIAGAPPGDGGWAAIPLIINGHVIGGLDLRFDGPRTFGAEEREFAVALARQSTIALERACLFDAERRARKQIALLAREAEEAREAAERATVRISQLQAITAAASEALTPREVAESVIRQAIEPVGACAGGFGQLTDDGSAVELMGLVGYSKAEVDPDRRIPLHARAPIPDAVREGRSIFLESAEEVAAAYPKIAAMHVARGFGAMAIVPLITKDRAVGGLGFVFPGPRAFSDDDRAFLSVLGKHCAQALARALAYEAERRAHVAADEANRLKDEFLATVSHELRTPLTAILGWARMLRTMKTNEATSARALETIERNAALQARLIDDLLDTSRIITGKLRLDIQSVDLATVIRAAIDAVSHAASARDIKLLPIVDTSVAPIEGDPSRLQQIVWNLLSNAIKFTPKGGTVEIRLDRAGPEAHIRVSDTGQGIGPDFLPFVFDRFRQADSTMTRSYGGLGLGLAIVRALVDVHGGTVHAASEGPGKGAAFTVALPLPQGPKAPSRVPVTSLPSFAGLPDLTGLRVLVVDDEPDSLDVVASVLANQGALVDRATSARAALRQVTESPPDVLVSDIAMPEEDGYELIRQVRLLGPEVSSRVAAVALTAYARVEDRVKALSAGYQMHVAKPVSPAELVTVVASLGTGLRPSRYPDRF